MFDDSKNASSWEVVGGKGGSGGKKNKTDQKKKDGTSKNGGSQPVKVVKVDELVTPLDTKYALLDPELRAQVKRDALGLPPPVQQKPAEKSSKAKAAPTKDAAKSKPSKGSEKKENKPIPKNLPEALKLIDANDLAQAMETVKARLPGSKLMWLRELTNHLNHELNVETEPLYSGKSRDYPSCLLTPQLRDIVKSTIEVCDEESLKLFLQQSLVTIPSEMNRGISVNGTKIVLQLLLAFHKPSLMLDLMSRASELITENVNRVPIIQTLLWVLAQPSFKDTCTGVQVWTETMLPLIGLKNFTGFIVQNLSQMKTKAVSDVKPCNTSNLSLAEYFKLSDRVPSLPANVRKDATDLVESLSHTMIATHGSKMFGQLLRRVESNRPDLCRQLVACLRVDSNSYVVWKKDYKANLAASAQLLQFIADHESSLVQSTDFRAALLHFLEVHDTFSKTKAPSEALKKCIRLCEKLSTQPQTPKKKSGSGKLKKINYLLLIALASVIYYDTRVFGDGHFDQSKVGLALQQHGITPKVQEIYHQYAEPYITLAGNNLMPVKDAIQRKGDELYPGIWTDLEIGWHAAMGIATQKAGIAYATSCYYADIAYTNACHYSNIALKEATPYWNRFDKWSAVYRQQVVDWSSVYIQQATELSTFYGQQVLESSKVYGQQALDFGKVYGQQALDAGKVYGQQAADLGSVYGQQIIEWTTVTGERVRVLAGQFLSDQRVQNAVKYTNDLYHKALHAVGICTH